MSSYDHFRRHFLDAKPACPCCAHALEPGDKADAETYPEIVAMHPGLCWTCAGRFGPCAGCDEHVLVRDEDGYCAGCLTVMAENAGFIRQVLKVRIIEHVGLR